MIRRPAPDVPARVRRRRRLLGWSAPVVLAALLVGSVLLGTVVGNLLGSRHYEAGRYDEAASQYEAQKPWTGFVEPWRAPFNAGTAYHRAGEHFLAVEELRLALAEVPPAAPLPEAPEDTKDPRSAECRVRTNLSLSIEAMGDDAVAVEDHPMAAAHYAEAQEVIDPCTASQENQEVSDRQQDKEDSAADEDGEEPTDGPTEEPTEEPTEDATDEPTEEPTTDATDEPTQEPTEDATDEATGDARDEAREELEERNREAERERQEQRQQRGGGFGGGQNW